MTAKFGSSALSFERVDRPWRLVMIFGSVFCLSANDCLFAQVSPPLRTAVSEKNKASGQDAEQRPDTPTPDPADVRFFENSVRPLLIKRCLKCHSGRKTGGGLSLESRAAWQRGGDSGPVIVPGRPARSLPGNCQGTFVVPGTAPVANVTPRIPVDRQREELHALRRLNQLHFKNRAADDALQARMQAFETAFGMQMAVPDAFDFSRETQATLGSYGLEPGQTTGFGWQCLAARRLVERGVRFVELIDTGSSANWDAHGDMMSHVGLAKNVDQPIAALLKDLKQRGLLDETLVVWTTEFGRTPFNNTADAKGREHHPWAFSSWLAGAGVKRGIVHGATDEHGLRAVERPVDVHDFHATILHLMGFDHERLTYRHAGRDFRLTDVHGNVVRDILA